MSDTGSNSATSPSPTHRDGGPDDQISLDVHTSSGRIVVSVGGEVDMLTSPQLRTVVLQQLDPAAGAEMLILSLDGISFLGTSGLAVLVEMRDAARNAGVPLRLACRARRVLRPLVIAGLVPLFDVHETLSGALSAD